MAWKTKTLILIFAALLVFSGCSFRDDEIDPVDINTLNIADDFNYEMERWVQVELAALYTGTFYLKDMSGNMLFKGTIDQDNGFKQKIKLPARITDVKLEYHEAESVFQNYRIRNNKIVYSFVPQYR